MTYDKETINTKIKLIGGGDGGVAIFNQLKDTGYDLDNSYLVMSSKSHQVNNPLKDKSNQFTMISTTDGMGRMARTTQSILNEIDGSGNCPLDVIMYDLLNTGGKKISNLWVKVCTIGGGTDTAVSSELSAEVNDYNISIDQEASVLEGQGKISQALLKRTERVILINLVSMPYESDCDSRALKNIEYAEENIFPSCNYMMFYQGEIAKETGEDHSLVLPSLTLAVKKTLNTIFNLYNYKAADRGMAIDKSDVDSMFWAKGKSIFGNGKGNDVESAYKNAFDEIHKFDALADDKFCKNAMFIFEYKTKELRNLAMINQETIIKKSILKHARADNFLKYLHNYNPNLVNNVEITFGITGINIDNNANAKDNDSDIQNKAHQVTLKNNADIIAELQYMNNVKSKKDETPEAINFSSDKVEEEAPTKDFTMPMTQAERNSKGGTISSINARIKNGTAAAEDYKTLYELKN